jgi:hypothetical protein
MAGLSSPSGDSDRFADTYDSDSSSGSFPEQGNTVRHRARFLVVGRVLWVCSKGGVSGANFDETDDVARADLFWSDKMIFLDKFKAFPPALIVNRIPRMNEISFKTTFFELLRHAANQFESLCSPRFIPRTWSLPADRGLFCESVSRGDAKGPWILKPADGQCGYGICFVFGLADDLKDGHVVQEYIRPLVFRGDDGPWGQTDPRRFPGHKWDWRVYVMLVHAINGEEFGVYFSHFGLLRFCSEPYEELTPNSVSFSQITNLSINVRNPNLVESPVRKWIDSFPAIRRRVNEVKGTDAYQREYDKNDPIVNRIKEISLFVALAIRGSIDEKLKHEGFADRPYFHVVGLDLMFDDHGDPYLLELNDRPSMIRRPEDDHEKEKMEMIQEELEIIFHHKPPEECETWEKLYPQIPSCLSPKQMEFARLAGLKPRLETGEANDSAFDTSSLSA